MSERWCCLVLQAELGPMDVDELRDLAASGTLGPGDLVRLESDEVWHPASKRPELRGLFSAADEIQPASTSSTSSASSTKSRANRRSIDHAEQARGRSRTGNEIAIKSRRASEVVVSTERETGESSERDSDLPARSMRDRLIACGLTILLLTALLVLDRLIAFQTPTFPPPRHVREQLAALHWFLGTGPWSGWELALLWFDAVVIAYFIASWLQPRWMARSDNCS